MNKIVNESIFQVEADILVIPISTEGNISNSFEEGLENLNFQESKWKNKTYKLGEVNIYPSDSKHKYIAFACSVDKYNSKYFSIRLIGKNIAESISKLNGIKKIASPILGTGAGKLNPNLSFEILTSSFQENKKKKDVNLLICTIDREYFATISTYLSHHLFDTYIPSGQQVLLAELSNIRIDKIVEHLQYSKEYYFELAEKKFNEFLNFNSSKDFYSKLSDKFNSSRLTFKEFIYSNLSERENEFILICGELISYIDYNAYHKNIWNKNIDKRVLARSGVRQNFWFLNLIKFKINNNETNSLSPSIKNAIIYLESPENNLTMLSENHRRKVNYSLFDNKEYNKIKFERTLFKFFEEQGIRSNNIKNLGVLYSHILYLPFIKPIWDETDSNRIDSTINLDLTLAIQQIEDCLKNKGKKLDLGNCGLESLEVIPELFECTHIEELILSNQWAELRNNKWTPIKSKNNGGRNKLNSIPKLIYKLSNLKILICGGDWKEEEEWHRWGIKSISPILELRKLEYLNLSNNKIKSIVGINRLENLKVLHLNNNEISVTPKILSLNKLNEVYLSNNLIKNISFIKEPNQLETLDLHNNYINDLSPIIFVIERIGISNSKWGVKTLNIAKNPLEKPPMEIIKQGKESVLGYFEDIKERGGYINKEIKVILAGNSEVGKTTFLKYLDAETDLEVNHLPTIWMEEKIIESKYSVKSIGEKCILHVFDFGGHDYYHDTHHLFYGSNTIYILLWEKNTNNIKLRKLIQDSLDNQEIEIETQDYPIRYWLDSIKYYTKDIQANNFSNELKSRTSYNSQLLLIQNKVENASKIKLLNNKKLKKYYPFIYDIINLSLLPKRNTDHFDNLFNEILNEMEIIGSVLPKFYKQIKKNIANYKGEPILSFDQFKEFCNKHLNDPINDSQTQRLVNYLKDVGLILYSEKSLEKSIYIDKKWVILNMHKILEKLYDKKGEFNREFVIKVIGVDDKNVDNLLFMMEEFKIIFKHPYSDIYIAPLYLPKLPDKKVNLFLKKNQIPFRKFKYKDFIQKSVILSIFQKFGSEYPLDKSNSFYYYWKDGLIIKNPSTDEIFMILFYLGDKEGNASINIYDLSNTKTTKFKNEVIDYILEVNKDFNIDEMVTIDGKYFISKKLLEANAKIGKHIFTENKLKESKKKSEHQKIFKLKDYMEFIENPIKKKKVVISYSKHDLKQLNQFKRHLQSLVDLNLIDEPWCCENLITGSEWDLEIKSKFNEADIIFFMVSSNLLSTKYVLDNEIKTSIEKYDKNKTSVKIVPIILEYCIWERPNPINLQRFSAMPFKGKPICDFLNVSIVWYEIVQAIKIMIENDISTEKGGSPSREIQELYERQVEGKLDNNSI